MQQFNRRDWLRMMVATGLLPALPSTFYSKTPAYMHTDVRVPIDPNNPAIVFDEKKCIFCGSCKRVCRRTMSVDGYYDLKKTGNRPICVHCGQCSTVCEGEAILMRPEWQAVKKAKSEGKTIVVSLSPAVRVTVSEAFGKPAGAFCEGEVIATLRALGADYVLDTSVGADITILEEAKDLVDRLREKVRPLPLLTSCCPAWVEFCETYFPNDLPKMSTAKSPIGMQGVAIKTFFAKQKGINPENIFNVALTPCPAKKFEIRRPEFEVDGLRGMDAVVTVRELADWMMADGIDYNALQPSRYDPLLGQASGAGIIFGNTGGVMEAVLRTAHYFLFNEPPPTDFLKFEPVRGLFGSDSQRPGALKHVTARFSDTLSLEVLVVQGLANARKVLEQLHAGELKADIIEVMACEGGCIGGAGLPRAKSVPYLTRAMRQARIAALYACEGDAPVRSAHENPNVKAFYSEVLGEVGGALAQKYCHASPRSRASDLGK